MQLSSDPTFAKKSWRRRCFESFESNSHRDEFYKHRKNYILLIYIFMAACKGDQIFQCINLLFKPEIRQRDELLMEHYPDTDEGNEHYKKVATFTLC